MYFLKVFGLEVRCVSLWLLMIISSKVGVVRCCSWRCIIVDIFYVSISIICKEVEWVIRGILSFWSR